jgi:hypothetical protein
MCSKQQRPVISHYRLHERAREPLSRVNSVGLWTRQQRMPRAGSMRYCFSEIAERRPGQFQSCSNLMIGDEFARVTSSTCSSRRLITGEITSNKEVTTRVERVTALPCRETFSGVRTRSGPGEGTQPASRYRCSGSIRRRLATRIGKDWDYASLPCFDSEVAGRRPKSFHRYRDQWLLVAGASSAGVSLYANLRNTADLITSPKSCVTNVIYRRTNQQPPSNAMR